MSKIRALYLVLTLLPSIVSIIYVASPGAQAQGHGKQNYFAHLPDIYFSGKEDIPEAIYSFFQSSGAYPEEVVLGAVQFVRREAADKKALRLSDIERKRESVERQGRRSAVQSIVSYDQDFDGKVTREEVEAVLRERYTQSNSGRFPNDGGESRLQEDIRNVMKADMDGDGTVTLAEAANAFSARKPPIDSFDRHRQLISLDIDGDGAFSTLEAEAIVRAAFPLLDENGNGVLDAEEKRWIENRQRGRQEIQKRLKEVESISCDLPPADKTEDVTLVALIEGAIYSDVTVAGHKTLTYVTDLKISTGREKSYLVLAADSPMIWRIREGADKISKLVVVAPRGNDGAPVAGVMGIARDRVSFRTKEECVPLLRGEIGNGEDALPQAKAVILKALGKAPAVVSAHHVGAALEITEDGKVVWQDRRPLAPENPSDEFDDKVWRAHIAPHEKPLARLNSKEVISLAKPEPYIVLPTVYGVASLVKKGDLTPVPTGVTKSILRDSGRTVSIIGIETIVGTTASVEHVEMMDFRLEKDIGYFPPGLSSFHIMKFLVPHGIAVPAGDTLLECARRGADGQLRVFASRCR